MLNDNELTFYEYTIMNKKALPRPKSSNAQVKAYVSAAQKGLKAQHVVHSSVREFAICIKALYTRNRTCLPMTTGKRLVCNVMHLY